jgi:hypothetical protein
MKNNHFNLPMNAAVSAGNSKSNFSSCTEIVLWRSALTLVTIAHFWRNVYFDLPLAVATVENDSDAIIANFLQTIISVPVHTAVVQGRKVELGTITWLREAAHIENQLLVSRDVLHQNGTKKGGCCA